MNLVFLGPPGAGKGTAAKTLSGQRGWPHLSSGDILRAEVQVASPLGKKAACYMEAGQLVPDALVVDLMVERVTRPDCRAGFILDGFPRTDAQAEALDAALADKDCPLDAVIYFACGDAEVVRRISGRRTCPDCGAIYHVQTLRPKADGVCDRCGGQLVQRKDDTAEVVSQRLATYRCQTEPLIDYYRRRSVLHQIDAARTIEAVDRELAETIERLCRQRRPLAGSPKDACGR